MQYVVKKGAKAFLDNSLRTEGYVYQVEKPFPSWPLWAEPEGHAVASEKRAEKPKAHKPARNAAPEPVPFGDTDLLENPTVVL